MMVIAMDPAQATILIVEDDPGVALLQKRCLERAGYSVRTASTVLQALAAVRAEPIGLMLLDNGLAGGETGLRLYAETKAAGYHVPAIIVTGSSEESLVIQALRDGVSDFVTKTPDYLAYLAESVRRVLDQAGMQKQLEESEARFHSFMDHCPAVAFVKDQANRLVYANRLFEQVFQCFDWQGKQEAELWPADVARSIGELGLDVSATTGAGEYLIKILSPNAGMHDWASYRFPMRDSQGQPLLGVFMLDVTERLRAQEQLRQRDEQLRQSQKFEALGNLASGIANEFNNLLRVVACSNVHQCPATLLPFDQPD
jgi:two-component system cell cycle sensor histidine kinase/response regulator CckA